MILPSQQQPRVCEAVFFRGAGNLGSDIGEVARRDALTSCCAHAEASRGITRPGALRGAFMHQYAHPRRAVRAMQVQDAIASSRYLGNAPRAVHHEFRAWYKIPISDVSRPAL